jgi:hypothetical protein
MIAIDDEPGISKIVGELPEHYYKRLTPAENSKRKQAAIKYLLYKGLTVAQVEPYGYKIINNDTISNSSRDNDNNLLVFDTLDLSAINRLGDMSWIKFNEKEKALIIFVNSNLHTPGHGLLYQLF